MPLSLPMRWLFGRLRLRYLMPPDAFPGADLLDWVGLVGSIAMLVVNFLRGRKPAAAARLGLSRAIVDSLPARHAL